MSWHVDQAVLDRYQTRSVDRVTAASVESHVTGCQQCRGLLAVDHELLERTWIAVAERVEVSVSGVVERILIGLRVPAPVARIVAVSPALRISFVLAVALVMSFAAVAAGSAPTQGTFRIFLIVAPLLPVAGVAFAYGRLVDPVHELTMASPVDSFRLLMLRTATVLSVSFGLGLLVWPLVPVPASVGISAWLLPSLTLTFTTLALASRFEVWVAGAMVGGGWAAAMLLALLGDFDAFAPGVQIVHAAIVGVAVVAVVTRRHHYDREGGR
ncbi:MAG: zf-HC2 domain-containing protein [Acidimicrobiia bacterium]